MPDCLPDPDSFTLEENDEYVSVHIRMPLDGKYLIGTVKRFKRNINEKPIIISNDNPLLDTRLYRVELTDDDVE